MSVWYHNELAIVCVSTQERESRSCNTSWSSEQSYIVSSDFIDKVLDIVTT